MPIEVLTIGGTGFIGNRLVSELLAQGHRVTVASRDRKAGDFGRNVVWRQVDRRQEDQLRSVLRAQRWDLVYDLACFDRTDAQVMAKAMGSNVGRYIMISSASVYPYGERLKEADFPPPLLERLGEGSGKRGAEAAVYQSIRVPSAIVRLPFVLGICDPFERIQYYIRRSRKRQKVSVPNVSARFSLLTVEEAVRFLAWLGSTAFEGSTCGSGTSILPT
jgi:nucleoside-diphosphate-sugar epimerase